MQLFTVVNFFTFFLLTFKTILKLTKKYRSTMRNFWLILKHKSTMLASIIELICNRTVLSFFDKWVIFWVISDWCIKNTNIDIIFWIYHFNLTQIPTWVFSCLWNMLSTASWFYAISSLVNSCLFPLLMEL